MLKDEQAVVVVQMLVEAQTRRRARDYRASAYRWHHRAITCADVPPLANSATARAIFAPP
jgi:hypothetical protein